MSTFEELRTAVEARIAAWCAAQPTDGLHAPMIYLMRLPAKRVRPVAVLMGCELFGGRAADALDEALGIELFHNFTLMHDDIMDAAPLRRGRPTVHERWNVNTAILSGDAMFVHAGMLLARRPQVLQRFHHHALGVCQGQQLDMDFEKRGSVRAEEYVEMIRLKTAVLLACALEAGALVAGAEAEQVDRIGAFGEHLGLAFQLRDDLLDAYGDPALTGKQRGGDLRAGKKTYLLIRGLELSRAHDRTELQEELQRPALDRDVSRMTAVLEALGVRGEAEAAVRMHDAAARELLDALPVPEERKRPLRDLADALLERVS
ncbi:MAG: polyprenyl synthetase family protein [Flavobacteriales bacterium]|nr:polyprenyl synthetase family protein [Flavobacteriales bacterium]